MVAQRDQRLLVLRNKKAAPRLISFKRLRSLLNRYFVAGKNYHFGIYFLRDRNSMFPFYPCSVLGAAIEVQTGMYKQRPTMKSPAWTVFDILQTVNNQPSPRLTD
jgi:hypothetical protein